MAHDARLAPVAPEELLCAGPQQARALSHLRGVREVARDLRQPRVYVDRVLVLVPVGQRSHPVDHVPWEEAPADQRLPLELRLGGVADVGDGPPGVAAQARQAAVARGHDEAIPAAVDHLEPGILVVAPQRDDARAGLGQAVPDELDHLSTLGAPIDVVAEEDQGVVVIEGTHPGQQGLQRSELAVDVSDGKGSASHILHTGVASFAVLIGTPEWAV